MGTHVTLPLHCAHCGGALSVEIQRWEDQSPAAGVTLLTDDPTGEDEGPEGRDAITTFSCPYCQKLNHGRLGGQFVWVVERPDEDEAKARALMSGRVILVGASLLLGMALLVMVNRRLQGGSR